MVVAGPVNMPALRMAANLVGRRIGPAVARAEADLPPECDWFLGNDANGPVIIKVSFTSLTFTLLQSSTANTAPTGLLAGTGSGPLIQIDPTTMKPAQTDTCTVSGTSDRFHQMTRQ